MNRPTRQLAIAVSVLAVAAPGAAAARGPGGWYTAKQLKAAIRHSDLSPVQKRVLLAEVDGRKAGRYTPVIPLGGPWYTPAERKALIARSTGQAPERVTAKAPTGSFHWSDASVGAVVGIGSTIVATVLGVRLANLARS